MFTKAGKLGIWNAYKLGVHFNIGKVGIIKLPSSLIHHPTLLARWLTPLDYVRYRELDFAFKAIKRYTPDLGFILDISSPKLFPLTIAHANPSAQVHSVDILNSEVKYAVAASKALGINNFEAMVQDARALGYDSGSFGVVTSLSVFEHIAPEKDGDIPAARELGRVTGPGGIAVVTVPFAKYYFAEYKTGEVYERTANEGDINFFQRFYNYELLMNNIVKPSGLKVLQVEFIEERCFTYNPHRRLAQIINSSVRRTLLFGLWFPILSHIFLSSPRPLEKCANPYIACLVLKKY